MIPKTKKKKQPHTNRYTSRYSDDLSSSLPPNLPPKLRRPCFSPSNPSQCITSLGCVTKSWRSSTRQCSQAQFPYLVRFPQECKCSGSVPYSSQGERYPLFYYMKNRSLPYKYNGSALQRFMSCSPRRTSSFIETEFSGNGQTINIRNNMTLTGTSSPAFAFSRHSIYDHFPNISWALEDCNIKEPYYAFRYEYMQFTNAIGFQGKFYVLSLQGSLVVIENIDSRFRVSSTGGSRAVPVGDSRHFREYLLEWNGEILLVFLISKKSFGVVDDVEVFKLDTLKLSWVKVNSLKESALFLGDKYCFGLNARKEGCRSNCIYFTHIEVNEWFVYVMGKGQIFNASGAGCARWDEPEEVV